MSQLNDQPLTPPSTQPELDTPERQEAQSRALARLLTRFGKADAKNKMLEKELKHLKAIYADLQADHAQLEVKYAILTKEHENSRVQRWTFQVHHARLQAEYESLRYDRAKLHAENEILKVDNEPFRVKFCRVRHGMLLKIRRLKDIRLSFKSK